MRDADPRTTDFDWWIPAYQRAVDVLSDPACKGIRIRVTGLAGCGHHEPTDDPATLERYAREIGADASYSGVSGNGRVEFPIGDDGEAPAKALISGDDGDLLSLNSLNSQPGTRNVHPEKLWPSPLDGVAYYGLTGELVRAIEPHTEADPVALMIQFLTAFGNVVGRGATFAVDGSVHHMNLFVVLMGRTSKGRKGTSWGHVLNVFGSVSPDWARDHIVSGLSSGEGLIWAVRDPIEKTVPIKDKGRHTGECETVVVDKGVEDKRLLVQEAEFASVLKVIAREGNTLSPIIRQAWDRGSLRSLTKNSPARATDAHISIVGHITAEELLRSLTETEMSNGFANRFQWFCVQRSKLLPEGGNIASVDFSSINRRLSEAIAWAACDVRIHKGSDAREIWRAVYPTLSEGHPGLVGATISRSEAQVLRLACLYALLDCSDVISRDHLLAALALWDYSEQSVRFVFGHAVGDPTSDRILEFLQAQSGGMTRTQISDALGRHVKSAAIDNALARLAQQGLVDQSTEETNGRPAERWLLVGAAQKAK